MTKCRVALLVVLLVAVAACTSPEAVRAPGGPGADIGNRGASIELHGRTDPFYGTPLAGQGIRAQTRSGPQAPAKTAPK